MTSNPQQFLTITLTILCLVGCSAGGTNKTSHHGETAQTYSSATASGSSSSQPANTKELYANEHFNFFVDREITLSVTQVSPQEGTLHIYAESDPASPESNPMPNFLSRVTSILPMHTDSTTIRHTHQENILWYHWIPKASHLNEQIGFIEIFKDRQDYVISLF